MKKKQFMSKLAALTMAAAMGITALPATAVFAQTTSIEASDTKLASSDYITVKKTFNGTDADADVSQDIVDALVDESTGLDGKDLYDGTAGGNSTAATTIADKLNSVGRGSGSWTISDLNMTDADHYSFNAKQLVSGTYNVVIAIDGTDDAALTKAVDAVNATTYASPDGTTYTEATLKNKIAADLKANGFNGDVTWGTGTLTPAIDATHNGVYVNTVNGKQIYVNLTYSSAQKAAATNAVIAGLGSAGSSVKVTSHDVVTAGHEVALSDVQTATEYDFVETTALSKAIQSTKATEAVSEKDGAKALQAYIESKLAEKKIDNNGVTVSVKPINVATATENGSTGTYTVADADSDATTALKGTREYLVTATIANDFNGWTTLITNSDETTYYYFKVTTNKITAQKTTGLEVADQTVNFVGKYYKNASTTPNEAAYSVVKVTPTRTPADANDRLTFQVTNSDGEIVGTVTNKGVLLDDGTNVLYDNASTRKAVTADDDTLVLAVSKPGTYTVKVTAASGVSKTATITINSNFKDVPATSYFANAVTDAYAGGVTNGVSATEFGANQNVTRAQFVTFLYNYAKAVDSSVEIKDEDLKQVYSDVPTTAYYAKAVQWAAENNVTSGTGNGKFSPDAGVTRAQAVTFIYNAKNKPDTGAQGRSTEATVQFSDVKKGAYYEGAVTWGVNNGVVFGLSTTTFGPEKVANRAQAISFIARAYASTTTNTDKVFTHTIADYQ